MKVGRISILAAVAVFGLGLTIGLARLALAAETSYQVDGVHSSMVFKIKHLNSANFYGRFNDISGKLSLGAADASKNSVEITVKADTVDTGNQKRDEHLKGPDFFNVKQFPAISFKSKEVKETADGKYDVSGELTLHGVTKPLQAKFERTGSGKGMRGEDRAGFETTFTIKRSDFGMKFMVGPLGDDVQITMSVETLKA